MMDNTELLDHYVGKLIDCLAEDRIFPPHPRFRKNYEEADIAEAESTLTKIKNSDLSAFKKALIWTGLRISASFVHVFCPPANINIERRFLVNPDKLYELLKGKEQPIRYEMSRYMCSEGRVNLEHFVASCNTHWEMRIPWLDHEHWSNISPNAPSRELKSIAKRGAIKDNGLTSNDADHYIDGGATQAMIDY